MNRRALRLNMSFDRTAYGVRSTSRYIAGELEAQFCLRPQVSAIRLPL
jgi:hypothetical protein